MTRPAPQEASCTRTSALRQEVGALRARERHESFGETLYVGQLGGPHACCTVAPEDRPLLDAGMRTELAGRLLGRLADATHHGGRDPARVAMWLTRPGEPSVQDTDLAWMAATDAACREAGTELDGFWAVTRTGWLDLRTGETRTWRRLRL